MVPVQFELFYEVWTPLPYDVHPRKVGFLWVQGLSRLFEEGLW